MHSFKKVQGVLGILILLVIMQSGCAQKKKSSFNPDIGLAGAITNIPLLKSAGYDFVQPPVGDFLMPEMEEEEFLENLRRFSADSGYTYACNIFLPGSLKSTGPEYNPEGILEYAEKVFQRAEKAGVKVIVFGSSGSRSIPEGFSREEAERQFIDLGKNMGPLAEKYGVTVAIENLNRDESNFINTVAEALDIVRQIDHDNIRITADIYHMLREGESPEVLRVAGDYIHHCDIAEKEARTPPGTAGDDFRPYLQALKDIDYTGKIALEARWSNLEEELPVALAELRNQMNSLE